MKLNKFIYILTGAALMLGAWACTDKIEYDPAPAFQGDDVFFPDGIAATYDISTPSDVEGAEVAPEVKIAIRRYKADDALTVNLTSTVVDPDGNDAASIFTVPSTVEFAAGQKDATIVITYDFEKVVAEVDYLLDLKIDGQMTSPYGADEIQATLVYAPWSPFERVGGEDEYATYALWAYDNEVFGVAAYVSKSLVPGNNNMKFQFGDYECPELNPNEDDWSIYANGGNGIVNVYVDRAVTSQSGKVYYPVTLEPIYVFNHSTYGECFVTDIYTYVRDITHQENWADFYDQSLMDPETGYIDMRLVTFCSAGTFDVSYQYIQLPGYTLPELKFNLGNHIIDDATRQEMTQIDVTHNDLVASYVFDVFDKALTVDEIAEAQQAMRDNDSQAIYTEADASYDYYFRTPGTYSVVYLAFNANGDEIASLNDPANGGGYWQFNYEPAIPFAWKSLGKAKYTDGFLYSIYDYVPYTWEVEVEQSLDDAGIYRIVNPYRAGNGWKLAKAEYDQPGNYYITINMTDPTAIYIEQGSLGIQIDKEDGVIHAFSAYPYALNDPNNTLGLPTLKRRYAGVMNGNVLNFHGKSLLLGWSKVLNNQGNFEWEYTNLWADDPDAKDATQWTKFGEFALDMSTLSTNAAAAPAKKLSGVKAATNNVKKGAAKAKGSLKVKQYNTFTATKNLK